MGDSTEPLRDPPDSEPLKRPEPADIAPKIQSAGADKPRVLVIDDSRVIRRAIVKILSKEFDLIEAVNGEIGWQALLADESIQVVISDVEMPELDGYSLICRIRASEAERVRGVPVIIITGGQDEVTRERAFACGATDFIIKPIDGVQLLARVRAHARLDQTTRALSETTKTLEDQSAVDPLTQLHSRRYFLQRAAQDLAYATRHDATLSIARIDIDNFRNIYKQLGDDGCDQMLIWLAGVFRAATRVEDTLARIGGSQFAVLAPATDRAAAAVLCERLRAAAVERPFEHETRKVAVTISLGVGTLGPDGDSIERLLVHADQCLILAKAAGGNRQGVSYKEEVPAPEEATMQEPDVETALKMLSNGEVGKLAPFVPSLLARLMPLLEYCDKHLDAGLQFAIKSLKEKLRL